MFRSYCRAQKLRAGLLDDRKNGTASPLKDLRSTFRHVFDGNQRGTLMSDILESSNQDFSPGPNPRQKTVQLDSEIVDAIKQWFQRQNWRPKLVTSLATVWSSMFAYGVTFKPCSANLRDSYVVVGNAPPDSWKAAQIVSIFEQTYAEPSKRSERNFVLCEIKYYQELTEPDLKFDFYRRYPHVGGKIYYKDLEPKSRIISATEIICHFARTEGISAKISRPHFHALPLDRVSANLLCFI